jgi:hypothetical protein
MEPYLYLYYAILRLETDGLEEQTRQNKNSESLQISVALYNIERCSMSILLQHLLHRGERVCYFLARHAAFVRNLR